MIEAKQINYNGEMHRSILEGRWHNFFGHTNAKVEYEPKRFFFKDGTSYLPDFRLTMPSGIGRTPKMLWIEVKGEMRDGDYNKLDKFVSSYDDIQEVVSSTLITDHALLLVSNIPWIGDGDTDDVWWDMVLDMCREHESDRFPGSRVTAFSFSAIDGDCYPAIPAIDRDGNFRLCKPEGGSGDADCYCNMDIVRTVGAYKDAVAAKFRLWEGSLNGTQDRRAAGLPQGRP